MSDNNQKRPPRRYPDIVFRSRDKSRIQLSVFNGSCQLAVFDPETRGPIFSRSLTLARIMMLYHKLKEILKASPSTNIAIPITAFDRETKSNSRDYVIVISRDENRVISFKIETSDMSVSCELQAGYEIDIEGMTRAERSELHAEMTCKYLMDFVPILLVETTTIANQRNDGGGSSGGGGYKGGYNNRSKGGGGNYNNKGNGGEDESGDDGSYFT